MFIRRIFYDKQTNEILCAYMMRGDIKHLPQSSDFAVQPALQGRSPSDTAVMEWLTPDPIIEVKFEGATWLEIIGGQIVFHYDAVPVS